MENYFIQLNNINVNDKAEKKNGLTYLSWAFAWGEVKKLYPDATYTIYEVINPQGYTCNYFSDGKTCWVKTGVTINGLEHIEELPVMDYKNRSIPLESVTSFDVNKAIQRSLTKAVARHGLGLYIYAGEDLPEEERKEKQDEVDDELKEKIESRKKLEQECEDLGIDLQDEQIQKFIKTTLYNSTRKTEVIDDYNLGCYNNILVKLISKKKGGNNNE